MRIGFLINPIAGMGGHVGLKGTDGVIDQARALGAQPVASSKAAQALGLLKQMREAEEHPVKLEWLT